MNVKYCRILFLSIMVMGCFFSSGLAQAETKVAVVNIQRIMSDSKAAKNIQSQLDVYRKAFQKEFSKREKDLMAQEKTIMASRSSLSAEEFEKKRQEFEGQISETRKLVQKKKQSLEQAAGQSLTKLRKRVVEIVAAIADKEGYDLIVTRQNVILAKKEMDITDQIMKSLNRSLKTIDLNVDTK